MVKLLTLVPIGDWIQFLGRNPTTLGRVLSAYVSTNAKRFNRDLGIWEVHKSELFKLTNTFYSKYWDQVDKSRLGNLNITNTNELELYSLMYILPTAPNEVIRTVYKTLSSLYHPDHGGSQDKMTQLNKTYELIKKTRGIT